MFEYRLDTRSTNTHLEQALADCQMSDDTVSGLPPYGNHEPPKSHSAEASQPANPYERIEAVAGILASRKRAEMEEHISFVERVRPLIFSKASVASYRSQLAAEAMAQGSIDRELLGALEVERLGLIKDLEVYHKDLELLSKLGSFLKELGNILGDF
jgi:hypothetical protein